MEKLVKVAVDAMGGDHAPGEVVKGAVDAVNEKNNLKVFLVGKAPRIHEELSKYQYKNEQIEVVNAEEEISCDESPVEAIRKKKDSSMVVALKMVKDKTADAFVSAGSSGAILVGGQFVVGRIKGIKRAPLGAVMPTAKGPMLLVDAGARRYSSTAARTSSARRNICFSLHRWDLSIWKMFLESRTQELDLSMSVWKKPKEISW